ncbi:MAG: short-chain dehydrogenase [Holophagae bacterium]|nr:MAG: short-chain dehydrogenase [Holophagae bacterium]
MVDFRHALVIGASSGIGEAVARRLAGGGARVALVARRAERLDEIAASINGAAGEQRAFVFAHDVRETAAVPELLQRITTALGGLDLVVCAAAVQHRVAFDEFDVAKDQEMLAVNLMGAVAWLDPVAERFGRLRRGTIVGIGSVAGDRGRSANPIYNTSKAGLHTFLEAIRNRIGRYGVRVVTVKPGFVETRMTAGMPSTPWKISADRAAEIILRRARRGPETVYVPARWRYVMWVIRAMPSCVFKRLRV